MKILSLSTPEIKGYAQLTAQNHLAYCKRHDYQYVHLWDTRTNPPSWEKLNMILKEPDGAVFWIDADAQFMNFDRCIEDFQQGDDFTFSYNVGLNAGVFLVQLHERSRQVVRAVNKMVQFKLHTHWEQAAFLQYFKDNPDYFNSHVLINKALAQDGPSYRKGDFIVHLPGTTQAERINAFTNHFRKDG